MVDTFPLLFTEEANCFMFLDKMGTSKANSWIFLKLKEHLRSKQETLPQIIATEYQGVNFLWI